MWEVKTMLSVCRVGPDSPVTHALHLEIFVYDSPHPELVDRRCQCHAVYVPGAKGFQLPAHFSRQLILRPGARLQRIVLGDQNLVALNLPAMRFKNAVLQNVSVIVEVISRE